IDLANNNTCSNNIQTQSSTTDYPYERKYCNSGGRRYYRRIDNLKMGVSDLVRDPELQGIVKIGIRTYPRQSSGNTDNGHIDVPAKKLDAAHKSTIDSFVLNLRASGGTPAAQAYAEAGAYMMGTTTNKATYNAFKLEKETYRDDKGSIFSSDTNRTDSICVGWESID